MTDCIHVAVLCVRRPGDLYLFIQHTQSDNALQRYWHLPSFATVHDGNFPIDKLRQCIAERYGADIQVPAPFLQYQAQAGDHRVSYRAYLITQYRGVWSPPDGEIGYWENSIELRENQSGIPYPILPTQMRVVRSLQLPHEIFVTDSTQYSYEHMLNLACQALRTGCGCICIREKKLDTPNWTRFVKKLLKEARKYRSLIIVNDQLSRIKTIPGIRGVHLDTTALHELSERPAYPWVTASCHTPADFAQARQLGVDAIFFGPIQATTSHPGQPGVGYQALQTHTQGTEIPIIGIGGLSKNDVAAVQAHGGYGVAGIRHFWSSVSEGAHAPGTV